MLKVEVPGGVVGVSTVLLSDGKLVRRRFGRFLLLFVSVDISKVVIVVVVVGKN